MRVGIVGCGQLARMLALVGIRLGVKFSFLADQGTKTDIRCVEGLGEVTYLDGDMDGETLYKKLLCPDVVTVEKEQVDLSLLTRLAEECDIAPPIKAIEACQHRHREKRLLDSLGIPNAAYEYAESKSEVRKSVARLKKPVVIKSVDQGYDGKNQWVLRDESQLEHFEADAPEGAYIVEKWIIFDKEVSLVAVRDARHQVAYYSPTENVHEKGILLHSMAPAVGVQPSLLKLAETYISSILEELDYVGVLAMECFVTKDKLYVNELAPRVHNSGHWTQGGARTCQFENHVRAITGLSLGSTLNHGYAGMINILGAKEPPVSSLSAKSTLHWYNKSSRPGRKLGHINFLDSSRQELELSMNQFQRLLSVS